MRFSSLFILVIGFSLLADEKEKGEEDKTVLVEQELKQVELTTGEMPSSVTIKQTITIRGKKLSVKTKGYWLRYIFDTEKKEIVVLNENEKSFYRIPFPLMSNYYRLIQEGKRIQLKNEKETLQRLPEKEKKEYKEKNAKRWAEIEEFLKSPEPDDVKVVEKELDEPVDGHKAKRLRIYADDRLVVEATLTTDIELEVRPFALLALLSPLPNKVRKEMEKIDGLPLRYRQIAVVGDVKQSTETTVKEIKTTKEEPQDLTPPKDYKELKEPTIVQNLRKLKEGKRLDERRKPPEKGQVK